MDSVLRDNVTDYARSRQPDSTAPQTRRTLSMYNLPWSTASHQTPSNINILWAFAQLQGSFEVDDTLIKPAEFNAVKRALFAESGLVGGGSLDALPQDQGWRDRLWWSGQAGPVSSTEAIGNAPSVSGAMQSGWTLADRRSRALADRTVPILSIPPTVFATDLSISPGESRTCAS